MIELYPHNQRAYDALCKMLDERGKACLVQPCGTGKAMIGFHYAEDHPRERVLWLSPSDYIFCEQNANLKREGGSGLSNVEQMTYAAAMARAKRGERMPHADAIILDEFHHCGAPEWSKGVVAVLERSPRAKVIGLSATNIRYTDNERDMADELFDGNVASSMGLEEAWLLGILPRPVYVTALYEAPKELEDMRVRIDDVKDEKKHGKLMRKYEKLRRALQEADGIDEVFAKHLGKRDAKIIVFCPNQGKLEALALLRRDWFKRVNPEIHVYKTYQASPMGEKDYNGFKEDGSGALKVLYCINQLNEGVHIDGIDAVVMIRPTVSPVIYTQQLGRAHECGSGKVPLVFDLVNNIASVGNYVISQESIVQAYEDLIEAGEKPPYTPGDFKIYDEIIDPRTLMEELKEALRPGMSIEEKIQFLETLAKERGGKL